MDDSTRMDKTPYNVRADFREVENNFRSRLDTLIPPEIAERVSKIIDRREKDYIKSNEAKAVNE